MKKIMLISSVILTIVVISMITINNRDKNEKNIIKSKEEEKEIVKSNMLTLMYETEAGSKEYVATKDNTWPEEGYIFNKNLSGCENGGELEYNSQNNTVNLLTNKSDKCYVYFDKYNGVWIDNVIATNITGSSITIDISATSENGSISKYYYQVNESGYIESTNNIITIEDLNKLTEYKIEVYAVDSTNAKSNIYELNVSTTDISIPIINNVSVSNIDLFGFTLTISATSENEISKYYFIIDSEDIAGITSENSYTFSNLEPGTSYNIAIYIKDINGNISKEYKIKVETEEGILLADYIKGLYTSQGANGIYYHTSSLANSAGDNSYRYAGSNPNNYVCFGSDVTPCPDDNLYRIIGIFGDEVKLIKWDYAKSNLLGNNGNFYNSSYTSVWWGSSSTYKGKLDQSTIPIYKWVTNNSNSWSSSYLNTINLNQNYLNNIGSLWSDFISVHTWKIGEINYSYNNTVKSFFNVEIENTTNGTLYSAKIGLMYVSDYGYAASPEYWTALIGSSFSSANDSDWLFMGLYDWTITRRLDYSSTWYVSPSGSVLAGYPASASDYHAVRPCFYLNSNVKYIGGSGTQSEPFRIGV